jgi:exonuclease III
MWEGKARWTYTNIDEQKIWTWNANGLKAKIHWLEAALEKEPNAPAIILVQETHIASEQEVPVLNGYRSTHAGTSAREAGVAIYYRSILPTREAPQSTSDRIRAIFMDDIAILTAYAPVESTNKETRETFYTDLAAHATHLRTLAKSVIMAGDFNAQLANQGHHKDNGNGQLVRKLIALTDTELIPQTAPTFIREDLTNQTTRRSTIDHFITSRDILGSHSSCTVLTDYTGSDHEIVELCIGTQMPIYRERTRQRQVAKLTYKRTNTHYQRLLNQEYDRLKHLTFSDMDMMYRRYTEAFGRAADTAIGQAPPYKHQTKEVRDEMTAAKAQHWKMRQEQAEGDLAWMETRTQRNKHRNTTTNLKKVLREKNRLQRKVEAVMSSATSTMNQMSQLRKMTRYKTNPTPHLLPTTINRFQKFWSEMYNGPGMDQQEQDSNIRLSTEQVRTLVKSLAPKKAPGPDGIKAELFRYGGRIAIRMLKKLLNALLRQGRIPTIMNTATI